MNSWFVLLLFGTLVIQVTSRPQQAEYNNDSDLEETEEDDDNDSTANDSYVVEDDMQMNDQEAGVQEGGVPNRHLDLSDNRYTSRDALAGRDKPSVDLTARHRKAQDDNINASANFLGEPGPYPTRHQSSRYIDASEEQQEIQRLINRDAKKANSDQNQNDDQPLSNKRTNSETTDNEEDLIFDKNKEPVSGIQKNQYNGYNDALDSEQPRYYKKYSNTMHTDRRSLVEGKHHEGRYNLRDRRDIKEVNSSDDFNTPNSQSSNDKDTEREESAIQQHLRKLSSAELNQLLNSLSEDKRELLKKTIEDTDSAGFNKREITKKAGALEENNYNENCQSDLSKVQGGGPIINVNTDSSSNQNSESTESHSKQDQYDNSQPTQKSSDLSLTSVNDLEVSSYSDGVTGLNTFNINAKNPANINPDTPVTSKTDKRETKLEDLNYADMFLDDNKMSGQDFFHDQEYSPCSQDENLSNIADDADDPHPDKTFKREAYYDKEIELSNSMKSLEESFPNSKAYDNSADSEPLVRVKRLLRNLPDAKVAFVPYKADNDDEDNDEGNESDDEGFFDRTSYFANSNAGLDQEALVKPKNNIRSVKTDDLKSLHQNLDGDMRSLGSDTDSVLSGVEGVDDNLMYSNGARNRRTLEVNPIDLHDIADSSTLLTEDENKSASENNINVPNYQENDAFGSLPRNYDGDSPRYKRIRRVKQLPDAEELNSSKT